MGFFSDAINKIRGVKEIEPKPKELDLSKLNLESFRSENWKNLEDDEKIQKLQHIENELAALHGREPRSVYIGPMDMKNGGSYKGDGNGRGLIYISWHDLDLGYGYKSLDTIFHESRHAYQDDVIHGRIPNNETEETKRLWTRDDEPGAYIPAPDEDTPGRYCDYFYQAQERDAFGFSEEKMNSLSDMFADDPGFAEYKNNRDKNRALAFEDARFFYDAKNEDEAAKKIDSIVEQRYNNLHQQDKAKVNNLDTQDAENQSDSEQNGTAESVNNGEAGKGEDFEQGQDLPGQQSELSLPEQGVTYHDADGVRYVDSEAPETVDTEMGKSFNMSKGDTVTNRVEDNGIDSNPDEVFQGYYNESGNDPLLPFLYEYEKGILNPDQSDAEQSGTDESVNNGQAEPIDTQEAENRADSEQIGADESANNIQAEPIDTQDAENRMDSEQNGTDESANNDEVETLDLGDAENRADSEQNGTGESANNDEVETLDVEDAENREDSEQNGTDESANNDEVETLDLGDAENRADSEQNGTNESANNDEVETLDMEDAENQADSEQNGTDESANNDEVETLDMEDAENQTDSEQNGTDESADNDESENLDEEDAENQADSEQNGIDGSASNGGADGGSGSENPAEGKGSLGGSDNSEGIADAPNVEAPSDDYYYGYGM